MVCLCEPQWPVCSQGLSQVEHPIQDTRQKEQRWKAWTRCGLGAENCMSMVVGGCLRIVSDNLRALNQNLGPLQGGLICG